MNKLHINKLIGTLTVIMLLSLGAAMTGCGSDADYSDSEYQGTWEATTAEYNGSEIEVSSVYSDGFSITLNKDGSAELDADDNVAAGVWEPTDNGVKLSGDDELIMKDNGDGTLTLDYNGISLNFAKEGSAEESADE